MSSNATIRSFSLRFWVPASLLMLLIFTVTAFQMDLWYISLKREQKQSHEVVQIMLSTLARNVDHDFRKNDPIEAQNKLTTMAALGAIKHLLIIDENGSIVFSSRLAQRGQNFNDVFFGAEYQLPEFSNSPVQLRNSIDGDSLIAFHQISFTPEAGNLQSTKMGWLMMNYDLSSSISSLRREMLIHLGLYLFYALVVFIALMWATQVAFFRPLNVLADYTRQLKQGRFPGKIDVQGSGEIAELTVSFVGMAESIRRNVEQLQLQAQTLEEQVSQRTKDLAEAVREANAANEAKSNFLANMSHEIRTPMNAISGISYLLQQTPLNAKQQQYVEKIDQSSSVLLAVINDILDLSKIESGKLVLEQLTSNPIEVLETAIEVVSLKAAEKALDLSFDIDSDVPTLLKCDPLRLKQILINLVNNAIKFTESGYVLIEVHAEKLDAKRIALVVSVQDSGIGMSKEHLTNLFKAFSQADNSITRRYGGTGLGLSICKSLVRLMGGDLGVDSELGVGSHFWFSVPLEVVEWADNANVVKHFDHDQFLLLCSEQRLAQVVNKALEKEGADVKSVHNAGELIQQLNMHRYRAVIMDWPCLKFGDGDFSKLSHCQDFIDTPKLFISSMLDVQKTETEAQSLGVFRVLPKPFLVPSIMASLAELLDVSFEQLGLVKTQTPELNVGNIHVLLVEDNPTNQEVFSEILASLNITSEIADNGQIALNLLQANTAAYDLVLMDIHMPVMDGYTTMREIQKRSDLKDIPIIALTANAFAKDKKRAFECGAVGFVAKPIEVAALQREIAAVFESIKQSSSPSAVGKHDKRRLALRTSQTPQLTLVPPTEPSAPIQEKSGPDQKLRQASEIDSALQRFNNNHRLYCKLLVRFYEKQRETASALLGLIESDREAAHREAHTLKGLLMSLGLEALAADFAAVESSLKDNSLDPKQAAVAIEAIGVRFNKLFDALDSLHWHGLRDQPPALDDVNCKSVVDEFKVLIENLAV